VRKTWYVRVRRKQCGRETREGVRRVSWHLMQRTIFAAKKMASSTFFFLYGQAETLVSKKDVWMRKGKEKQVEIQAVWI
jgi:hypothetical protein